MDFPLTELMDQDACYQKLLTLLHPDGLTCPDCQAGDRLKVHRRHRAPVLDYRCLHCGRVFNAWTGTPLQGTHRRPAEILLIIRGFAQGVPTAQLARELERDRTKLLALRHQLQGHARQSLDRSRLEDRVVEADELYQNAGEKGLPHDDPEDPPRRRANSRRGHGTFANDRPPVAGVIGRESGQVRLEVLETAAGAELDEVVGRSCREGAVVNTDEWNGYVGVGRGGVRVHRTVDHSGPKSGYAVDADGDGEREVHCNTAEGLWTGVRNFLRRFRGVSKWYLDQYVAMFEWCHNTKYVTVEFMRVMLGWPPAPI